MKLSIVTACRNMEGLIGQTLESIPQDTDLMEYIIVDGASDDATMDVISQHPRKVDLCISEPDEGQYHAISKGFSHSTGEIMGWINADDILMPWTASIVCELFEKFPEISWITGVPSFLNRKGQLVQMQSKTASYPRKFIRNGWYQKNLAGYLQQENMFWRRELWEKVGGLNLNYTLAADFDLWTRFANEAQLVSVAVPLAAFRERPGEQISSLQSAEYENEVRQICKNLANPNWFWRKLTGGKIVLTNIARLLIWRKSCNVEFCRNAQEWRKLSVFRSISRVGLADLVIQFRLRRRK